MDTLGSLGIERNQIDFHSEIGFLIGYLIAVRCVDVIGMFMSHWALLWPDASRHLPNLTPRPYQDLQGRHHPRENHLSRCGALFCQTCLLHGSSRSELIVSPSPPLSFFGPAQTLQVVFQSIRF